MNRDGVCILCGGALTESLTPEGYRWEDRVFAFQECRECRARIIQPLPTDEDLARIYRHADYHDTFYEECAPSKWPESIHVAGKGAPLLDFGCGNGAFLAEAARRGFEAVGVEPNPDARAAAQRNSGCEVLTIEDVISAGQRFDIIHLGDVLEHLPTPIETLRRLEPLLSDTGIFFIKGPLEENASLVRLSNRIFTQLKRAIGRPLLAPSPPYHLSRTSAASQRRFFEQTMGYELLLFKISETGWPYLLPGPPTATDAKTRSRRLIGKTAVLFAGAGRLFGLTLGNRFVAIATPAEQCRQIGVRSLLG